MENNNIFIALSLIIQDRFSQTIDIHPNTRLGFDLALDSIDLISFIGIIEDTFGVSIDLTENVPATVGDLAKLIENMKGESHVQ